MEKGEELARLYLRQDDDRLRERFLACFEIGDESIAEPTLVRQRIVPATA